MAGGGFPVVRLIEGGRFFGAVMQAAAIAFVAMVVLATAQTLLKGSELEEAEAPGGWRPRFSVARRAVGALERRLDAHQRATDQRLLDLEQEVFKKTSAGSGGQE